MQVVINSNVREKLIKKKTIPISTMSSVEPLREVVQRLAHTFNDPENRESNFFDFFFYSVLIQ